MNKLILVFSLVFSSLMYAQDKSLEGKQYIELSGTSETDIIPDQIIISIQLREHQGKEKASLDKQESDLKEALKELEIPLTDLVISEANANYQKYLLKKNDVVNMRKYLLTLKKIDSFDKLFKKLDELNVDDADIYKLNHTKLTEFAKANRIKAMQAAKEKVDYLLSAVGQKAGMPIIIREIENSVFDKPEANPSYYRYRGSRASNMIQSFSNEMSGGVSDKSVEVLSFTKIKLRASYHVKYEILSN
ncbi:MAG: SIMPL domain-containing protein [Bacteroidia bacterium]